MIDFLRAASEPFDRKALKPGVSALYRWLPPALPHIALFLFSAKRKVGRLTSRCHTWVWIFTMLMLVPGQRSYSRPWLHNSCMRVWVYLCACGFFAHVCAWCGMAGESQTTQFFILSWLLFFFLTSPLLFLSAHLASVNKPPELLRLRSRRSNTSYVMACTMLKGLIMPPPPNLAAETSGSTYPIKLYIISNCQWIWCER